MKLGYWSFSFFFFFHFPLYEVILDTGLLDELGLTWVIFNVFLFIMLQSFFLGYVFFKIFFLSLSHVTSGGLVEWAWVNSPFFLWCFLFLKLICIKFNHLILSYWTLRFAICLCVSILWGFLISYLRSSVS